MDRALARTLAAAIVALGAACGATITCAGGAPAAPGYQVQCFEDPGNGEQVCFAPSKLTANGSIRASPLYAGKGTDIVGKPLIAVADCKKSSIALRDAKGGVPKAAPKIDPRVAEALARDMCAVAKPAIDKSLKR